MQPSSAAWAQHGTGLLFFLSGLCYATWGVYIPQVALRFELTPAWLTATMLVVALGAMAVMGPVGHWIAQVGSARVVLLGASVVALAITLLPHAETLPALLACLLAFGAGNGMFDTAMNAQATTVERHRARSVLSGMHGLFKARQGWADDGMFALVGTLTCFAVCLIKPHLLPDGGQPSAHAHPPALEPAREPALVAANHPTQGQTSSLGTLWRLGLLAACGLLIEGAMYDWSAIYLREVMHAPAWRASAGYGGFCLGMTAGRFAGDALRMRWGDTRVLQASSGLALAGLLMAVLALQAWVASLGLAAVGLGAANLVPIFFAAGARATPQAPSEGIALVSRMAYVGFMLGPVWVGLVGQVWGLRAGLAVTGLCALWIAWEARRVGLKAQLVPP